MQLQTKRVQTSGLTLLELVVVVAILAFMAGLVTFNLTPSQLTFSGAGGNRTAARIATEATMGRIKDSMFGTVASPGYWQDMNRDWWYWPRYLQWLAEAPKDAVAEGTDQEMIYHTSLMSYSATRRVGWRGPYVSFVGVDLKLNGVRGFTSRTGASDPPTRKNPADGWGNPIVMQVPTRYFGDLLGDYGSLRSNPEQAQYVFLNARLVSAGPDGILQTELELELGNLQTFEEFQQYPEKVGDDVVVWLQR